MDKNEFPENIDLYDQEVIPEWIDETNQDFKLVPYQIKKVFIFVRINIKIVLN